MEKLEKKVLDLLQEDARYTAAKIAVLLGKAEKDIEAAIKSLEAQGIIVKYSAVVNTEKTGEDFVDALIEIKVTPQARSGYDAIAEQIISFDEVKDVYLVPPASYLTITNENGTLKYETKDYWKLGTHKPRFLLPKKYRDKLRELVTVSIKDRLDVFPGLVGSELSGGLDSGVMSILSHLTQVGHCISQIQLAICEVHRH